MPDTPCGSGCWEEDRHEETVATNALRAIREAISRVNLLIEEQARHLTKAEMIGLFVTELRRQLSTLALHSPDLTDKRCWTDIGVLSRHYRNITVYNESAKVNFSPDQLSELFSPSDKETSLMNLNKIRSLVQDIKALNQKAHDVAIELLILLESE